MPTATWANLDPSKRDRVLQAAMREFGARGFSAGSINVIAREADVAKGSVFQYFDDKADLYTHVAGHVARTVRDEFTQTMLARAAEHHDLFRLLRAILTDWVAYFRDHPLEREVFFAITFEIDHDSRRAIRSVVDAHVIEVLGTLLSAAEDHGQLRAGASRDHALSLLLLLVPHLATASSSAELDPVLQLSRREGLDLELAVSGYVDVLEAAVGAPAEQRSPADLAAALRAVSGMAATTTPSPRARPRS